MRKILALILGVSGMVSCSPSVIKMVESEEIIGKNHLTGKDVIAKTYTFPERIDSYYLDTASQCLTATFREKNESNSRLQSNGKIAVFDLAQKKSKWVSNLNFNQSHIIQQDTCIIKQYGTHCVRLSYQNGEKLWETSHRIIYSSSQHIALCLKSGWPDSFEGIDLITGTKLFYREMNCDFGINQLVSWNDSTVLLSAGGLHSFHKKYGYGMDYEAVTGKNDYAKSIAINTAGIALGLLTGAFVVYPGRDAYTDLVSNILIDSTNVYFASANQLAKFMESGDLVWFTDLPKDDVSKSVLFKKDSIIYMLNTGTAYYNNHKVDYGKPFLAAFMAKTGMLKYINFLGEDKIRISDYEIYNDTLMIVFNDAISKYRLSNGTLIKEKIMDPDTFGEQLKFVGDHVFVQLGGTFKSLVKNDPTHHYLYNKKGKVWSINKNLTVDKQGTVDQFYKQYLTTPFGEYIYKEGNTKVIDNAGKEIAEMDVPNSSLILGNYLYCVKDKTLLRIPINDLK